MATSQATGSEGAAQGSNHGHVELTLRALRLERGLSIRDVENLSGISRACLSMIERGRELPTPEQLATLADVYGVVGRWRFVTLVLLEERQA